MLTVRQLALTVLEGTVNDKQYQGKDNKSPKDNRTGNLLHIQRCRVCIIDAEITLTLTPKFALACPFSKQA